MMKNWLDKIYEMLAIRINIYIFEEKKMETNTHTHLLGMPKAF